MAKNKVSEWSSTAANNTDIGGIDIAEGCAPSGINNAIREMMAQIKDMETGVDGDSFTVGGNLSVTGTSTLTGAVTATAGVTGNLTGNVTGNVNGIIGGTTPAAATVTSLSDSGNLTFTGTGNRITGDFTNATLASRVAIQTSTANSSTVVGVLPSGTGTVSSLNLFGNSDTTGNSPYTILSQTGGKTRLEAGRIGSGTYGNMEFYTNGTLAVTVTTAQALNIVGAGNFGDNLTVSSGISTGDAGIELGGGRSGSGNAYVDFHSASGTDYDARVLKQSSSTGNFLIYPGSGSNGVYMAYNASAWSAISDETQKNIIEPITNGVDKVNKIRAVIGSYKSDAENTRHSFLIAQDVQKVLPEAVTDAGDGILGLSYTDVIPLLVSAINELTERVKQLESK